MLDIYNGNALEHQGRCGDGRCLLGECRNQGNKNASSPSRRSGPIRFKSADWLAIAASFRLSSLHDVSGELITYQVHEYEAQVAALERKIG